MYHQFSSMLAVLLLVIAAVTVLIMLEMNSKIQDKDEKPCGQSTVRRILGSVFLFLFASLLAYLIFSAGSFQENLLNSPQLLYIIIALLLVPLLIIRAVIARRRAQISTRLLLLGLAIFSLAFGLTGIAAKYYHTAWIDERIKNAIANTDSNIISVEPGQAVMSKKCSRCHTLERVYTTNITDWSATVSKMASLDPNNMSEEDIKLITAYLNRLQKNMPQRSNVERGRDLVVKKCGKCHSLEKIFKTDMPPDKWAQTIDDMMKIMGLPDFITENEKKDIVAFLTDRQAKMGEQQLGTKSATTQIDFDVTMLLAKKCNAGCHALDRILRAEKSRDEWVDTVNSMVEITGEPDFLSEEEKTIIIDYLSRPEIKTEKSASPQSSSFSHPMISRKCAVCHDLQRVHQAAKSKEEWMRTVKNMAAHADQSGASGLLSKEDQQDIITIISSWEVQQ
jgi:cytochrome c2